MIEKHKVCAFEYNPESLENDLRIAFNKLNYKNYIKGSTKVFIKPNFTLPFFRPGVTTNEFLLEAVAGIIKDVADEVLIGESDGGDESFTAEYSLSNHGIPDICKRTGATMINLSQAKRIRITDKINGKKIEVTLPKPLLNIDETISIPVLKVHVVTKLSLSIKNMWGCHPDTLRLFDHKHLSERLFLIAKSINLRFAVIDAIYGLNRTGPMDGDEIKVNAILVGDNPVATDSVAARMIGFNPQEIDHIRVASKFGLGYYEEERIDLLDDISKFRQDFYLKPTIIDRGCALAFKSVLLNKLISDSPFTGLIYKSVGKVPRKKIIHPGDEK
jgi:uncharacterized protein (DUF362 family)